MAAYHAACAEAIEAAGGYVAQYLGDGVLAYFGYPEPHEDDAARAILAARALVAKVTALHPPTIPNEELMGRVGIATGLVVVGNRSASGIDSTVVGQVPNKAYRLQELAGAGGIVVSDTTRRLARGLFEFRDLGTPSLKGFEQSEPVWAVVGEPRMPDLFDERSDRLAAPLAGRTAELEAALDLWSRCRTGSGGFLGIIGPAGIGKSRLAHEVVRAAGGEPHTLIEGGAAPIYQGTPFRVVVQMIRQLLGSDDPPAAEMLGRIAASLAEASVVDEHALQLIAGLLGLATPDSLPPLTLTADERRRRLAAVIADWLHGSSAQLPILMVVEDLHWFDPSTLELLDHMFATIGQFPILVLYTSRDDPPPHWSLGPSHARIDLDRLDDDAILRLVGAVSSTPLTPETVQDVLTRAEGVPLFAEELARLHALRGDSIESRSIPSSLSDLLMARLGQAGKAFDLAQIAAVLGGEFSTVLLAAIAGVPTEGAAADIEAMLRAGVIMAADGPGEAYVFKHALIRDAAYQALLRNQRKALHRRAAETIVAAFPDLLSIQPEVVAQHWTEAGDVERAIAEWQRAAQLLAERSAFAEALGACEKALSLIPGLPDPGARDAAELEIQSVRVLLLQMRLGFAAPATLGATARARELAEKGGDLGQQLTQLVASWSAASSGGDYRTAAALAAQIEGLAALADTPNGHAAAQMVLMTVRYRTGDLLGAEAAFARGIERGVTDKVAARARTLTQTYADGALVAWLLNRPTEAQRRIARVVAAQAATDQPYEQVYAGTMVALVANLLEDFVLAGDAAKRALELAEQHGFPQPAAIARIFLGRALAGQGDGARGAALLEEGLAARAQTAARAGATMHRTWLAEALLATGALDAADQALVLAAEANPQERFYEPERLHVRARVRASRGDREGAEADLRSALALAKAMSAQRLYLRAASGLKQLLGRVP